MAALDDRPDVAQAAAKAVFGVLRLLLDRGLRRRAQNDRHPVIARQLIDRGEARAEEGKRQCLRLVEEDDTARDVVQFAAA